MCSNLANVNGIQYGKGYGLNDDWRFNGWDDWTIVRFWWRGRGRIKGLT